MYSFVCDYTLILFCICLTVDHYGDASVLQADADYSVELTGSDAYYQQHQYVDAVVLPATADISGHGPLLAPSTFPLPGAQLSPEADYYNGMVSKRHTLRLTFHFIAHFLQLADIYEETNRTF